MAAKDDKAPPGVTAQGYLNKQGGGLFKSFKPHWCVLHAEKLEYFLKKEDKTPVRALDLNGCKIEKAAKPAHALNLSGPSLKKVYAFTAESDDARDLWFRKIETAIAKLSGEKPGPGKAKINCAHCGEGIIEVEGRFSGEYAEFPDGKTVHMECTDKYTEGKSGPTSNKCGHCKESLASKSGKVVVFDENTKDPVTVHDECKEEYSKKITDKCAHCNQPLEGGGGGKFSGAIAEVDGGKKVHQECKAGFAKGQMCRQCDILIEDPTTMTTMGNGVNVHIKCREAYELAIAPVCGWCKEKIVEVAGKFTGVYHDLEDGSKLHDECRTPYELDKRAKKEGRGGLEDQVQHAAAQEEGDEIYELANVTKEGGKPE